MLPRVVIHCKVRLASRDCIMSDLEPDVGTENVDDEVDHMKNPKTEPTSGFMDNNSKTGTTSGDQTKQGGAQSTSSRKVPGTIGVIKNHGVSVPRNESQWKKRKHMMSMMKKMMCS